MEVDLLKDGLARVRFGDGQEVYYKSASTVYVADAGALMVHAVRLDGTQEDIPPSRESMALARLLGGVSPWHEKLWRETGGSA